VTGVVSGVNRTGFELSARNSDCNDGEAGFYFMAVEEVGQPPNRGEPVDLRLGILQPKHFCPDCTLGDWVDWTPRFSRPFPPPPHDYAALVTGSNLHVRPFGPGRCGPMHYEVGAETAGGSAAVGLPPPHQYYYNAPAVGISRDLNENGFWLAARNSDNWQGKCAYYYVAGVEGERPQDPFQIDSGVVEPKQFMPTTQVDSLQAWEVYFSRPFLVPPVVLLTCKEAESGQRVAVVGLAWDVTTHGFWLIGANSDCAAGVAQFYWVAIGCGLGCG
jgi:hypothetical protein